MGTHKEGKTSVFVYKKNILSTINADIRDWSFKIGWAEWVESNQIFISIFMGNLPHLKNILWPNRLERENVHRKLTKRLIFYLVKNDNFCLGVNPPNLIFWGVTPVPH